MQRRPLLTALLSLATLGLPVQPALAQDAWPSKPVKLVSPVPAGGTSDVMARIVAEALSKELGQQVVVENIGGAGGTLGTLRATKAAPDGYTLVQTGVGQNAVAHGLDPKLGYDSLRDFVHISQVNSGPNMLVVNAAQPFKTIGELVNFVRQRLETIGFVVPASGSGPYTQFVKSELELWTRVIKTADIKPE